MSMGNVKCLLRLRLLMDKLVGKHIDKTKLKDYLNKKVIYLLSRDIDRSGRGYYFPRVGIITYVDRYKIDFDNSQEYHSINHDLREIVSATEKSLQANK